MAYQPWETTGVGPFLPLLSSDISKIVFLMRSSVKLWVGICRIRSDADMLINVQWSPTAGYPLTTKWQEVNLDWYGNYRSREDHPHALVLMPSALERMGYQEVRDTIKLLWASMVSGDVLIIPRSNNHRFLKYLLGICNTYCLFWFVRILGSFGRAYVCLGRNHPNLQLVSVQYHLQREFINHIAPSMKAHSGLVHQFFSVLGLYPWIEPEHIIIMEKC